MVEILKPTIPHCNACNLFFFDNYFTHVIDDKYYTIKCTTAIQRLNLSNHIQVNSIITYIRIWTFKNLTFPTTILSSPKKKTIYCFYRDTSLAFCSDGDPDLDLGDEDDCSTDSDGLVSCFPETSGVSWGLVETDFCESGLSSGPVDVWDFPQTRWWFSQSLCWQNDPQYLAMLHPLQVSLAFLPQFQQLYKTDKTYKYVNWDSDIHPSKTIMTIKIITQLLQSIIIRQVDK